MITITYADIYGSGVLGVYSPTDAMRFISNLQYVPKYIIVRESGITIVG